jgi:hypothetical protein
MEAFSVRSASKPDPSMLRIFPPDSEQLAVLGKTVNGHPLTLSMRINADVDSDGCGSCTWMVLCGTSPDNMELVYR